MKKILTLFFLVACAYAQDSSFVRLDSTKQNEKDFLLYYPGGYSFTVLDGFRVAWLSLGYERYLGEKWSWMGEFSFHRIPLNSHDEGNDLPGNMFGFKGAGRYYPSGRDGWFFLEPALAMGYVPEGFPGSDLGAPSSQKDQYLVEKYLSAGAGLGIRTGNNGKSKWSFTLGYHRYLPLWSQMTGPRVENDFENFVLDFLGRGFFDYLLPYRSSDFYLGFGYRL